MTWQEFSAFLVLATAMSFSPGPNTTLSTALAANHGLRRAMPFVCAVPVGWSALLVVCTLGLGAPGTEGAVMQLPAADAEGYVTLALPPAQNEAVALLSSADGMAAARERLERLNGLRR